MGTNILAPAGAYTVPLGQRFTDTTTEESQSLVNNRISEMEPMGI